MSAFWHDACSCFKQFPMAFGCFFRIFVVTLSILFAISATSSSRAFAPAIIFTHLTIIAHLSFLPTNQLTFLQCNIKKYKCIRQKKNVVKEQEEEGKKKNKDEYEILLQNPLHYRNIYRKKPTPPSTNCNC